ncbi:MAG: Pycsar system effector family protein [Saprospiraceae bacterium]
MDSKNKKKKKMPRETINVIRTTQRNNIDLTALADNKANVLLSLNALIITVVIPLVLGNIDFVMERYLYIPLAFMAVTCFTTIFYAAKVLKPNDFDAMKAEIEAKMDSSPFFFGNFYKMDVEEYFDSIKGLMNDPTMIQSHVAQDLYYIGRRLGKKMTWIRLAFDIFTIGFFLTLLTFAIVLMV